MRWEVKESSEEPGTGIFVIHLTHAPSSSISPPPGYHDNHIVIRWFWAAVERFNNEQRLRLLQVPHVGDRMHTGCPHVEAGCPAGTAESCLRLQKDVTLISFM